MLDGTYKSYLSLLALKRLTKPATIPDIELCIGDFERHDSLPVVVFREVPVSQAKPVTPDLLEVPYEKTGVHFELESLEMDDFPNTFDLNTLVEGWG